MRSSCRELLQYPPQPPALESLQEGIVVLTPDCPMHFVAQFAVQISNGRRCVDHYDVREHVKSVRGRRRQIRSIGRRVVLISGRLSCDIQRALRGCHVARRRSKVPGSRALRRGCRGEENELSRRRNRSCRTSLKPNTQRLPDIATGVRQCGGGTTMVLCLQQFGGLAARPLEGHVVKCLQAHQEVWLCLLTTQGPQQRAPHLVEIAKRRVRGRELRAGHERTETPNSGLCIVMASPDSHAFKPPASAHTPCRPRTAGTIRSRQTACRPGYRPSARSA